MSDEIKDNDTLEETNANSTDNTSNETDAKPAACNHTDDTDDGRLFTVSQHRSSR